MVKLLFKIMIGAIIIPILVFIGYRGYQQYLAPPPPTPTPQPVQEEQAVDSEILSAEGKVIPRQTAQLSFSSLGRVISVNAQEGEVVEAGDVIARLEGREQLEAMLASAQMDLISAQQALDEIISLAPLQTAQAQQELAYARTALDEAERHWENYQEGNRASGDMIKEKEEQLAEAEQAVARAQAEYSQYGSTTQDDAQQLVAYTELLVAEQVRDRIKSQLNWYLGSPSENDQALLDSELALAEGQLAEAERQWELLKDGPDQDKLALAQAQVASANAQIAAVQASLNDLNLVAPFTGTIVSLNLKVGESISPAVPVVVLADVSQWQVETIDLTENDIASLYPGMEAVVTLNAYPGQEFDGTVHKIGLLGEDRRGSVTYAVLIDFDPQDAHVRWGMTAFVDFKIEPDS